MFKRKEKTNDFTDKASEELLLLQACLGGKENDQRRFFEHFYHLVYKTVRKYLSNPKDLEETINDSFLKIFKSLSSFDSDKSSLPTWIKRVSINAAIDKYRKLSRRPEELSVDEALVASYNDPGIIDQLSYSDILNLVEGLPIIHKTVFFLYEIEGFSHKEIAESVGVSEAVSRSYLSRAKMKLRELLIKNYA